MLPFWPYLAHSANSKREPRILLGVAAHCQPNWNPGEFQFSSTATASCDVVRRGCVIVGC